MGRLNDIALVTQVAVFRNRRAFDQLVREYQSPVRRFFLNQTLGNEALADDLAQDTFLKAYTHIGQFRGTSAFLTWLTRIAYNVWYDYRRKAKNEQTEVGSGEFGTSAVSALSSPASHTSFKMDIYRAMAQLTETERTCITLQLIDGHPIDQIADITSMPVGTVKSHLSRGKTKLTTFLRANGYDR